jgi:hypothetical protein
MTLESSMPGGEDSWIGLAEVVARQGCDVFKEGYGAFVPVIANAFNEHAFYELVRNELKALRLDLLRMEDVERLSERRRKHTLPKDLETAIDAHSSTHRLAFGSFHAFSNCDAGQRKREE